MKQIRPATIHPALDPLVRRLKELGAQQVILYGSRARGDNLNPRADIDLAVDAPGLSDDRWYAMRDAIDAADTLLEIDLLYLQRASDDMARAVMTDGVTLQ